MNYEKHNIYFFWTYNNAEFVISQFHGRAIQKMCLQWKSMGLLQQLQMEKKL